MTVHDTLTPPATAYNWFSPLPDEDAVFLVRMTKDRTDYFQIAVLDLQSGDLNLLLEEASGPRYLPTGHLAFIGDGKLEVADFDLRRRRIAGPSYPTGVTVSVQFNGASSYSVSEDGLLVYVPAAQTATNDTLMLVDREQGMAESVLYVHPNGIRTPSFDPLGERIAFCGKIPASTIGEIMYELYVYDLAQGHPYRRPTPGDARWIVWTADGRQLIYAESVPGEAGGLYTIPADGSGAASQILPKSVAPISCSRGGVLAYSTSAPETGRDIWTLDLRENTPKPYLVTDDDEYTPQFSPNGRFIAYVSEKAGEYAVFVRPYPDTGGVSQISEYGGEQPVWGPEGRELFFRERGLLRVVPVTTDGEFTFGRPETLMSDYTYMASSYFPEYDIHPDGNRILFVRGTGPEPIKSIELVVNWFEELKRLQPPN
ncbi:hypothetical protein ACFL4Y_00835 [Gemmatimonadota bacterium]